MIQIGFLVSIVLAVLKLTDVVAVSWAIVALPFAVGVITVVCLFLCAVLIVAAGGSR